MNNTLAFKAKAQTAAASVLRVPPGRIRIELQDDVVLVNWPESARQQDLWAKIESAVTEVLPDNFKHCTVEIA
jgi:hypothetical protein